MEQHSSRRRFLQVTGSALALSPLANAFGGCKTASPTTVVLPVNDAPTSSLVLNVRDFGATGDGNTKDTLSIQQAIDRCNVLGGGVVKMPAGNYLTGAIQLRSQVTLQLEQEAHIIGTDDFADYPVAQVRWEGKWIKGHVGLLYAFDAENIAVMGPGKIIGNPALGGRPNEAYPLRHPALIEPVNCKNIRLEGFYASYHLMWCIHPVYSAQILIQHITIRSTGGNSDGIDIDSCKQVRIDHCDIESGDDCIAIKSGRGMEGYTLLRTTEDVHISNCTFADTIFACIGIGSETSGGIRNVLIENCRFTKARTFAVYIKSRPGRGAFIENILARNLEVAGMEGGFLRFNLLKSGLQDQDPVPGEEGIPTVKNFSFTGITVTDVPVLVEGNSIHPDKPLQGFTLKDVTGTCRKGITLANINHAELKNIEVSGYTGPLLSIHNVTGNGLEGAVTIEGPKADPPIEPPAQRYKLQ